MPINGLTEHVLAPLCFLLVAALYASVGQAGGTGYIAIMGLLGFGPDIIKPAALTLNILVAAIGCARFARVGLLSWRSFYPFAILGAPFSLLGGAINLSPALYLPSVGALLLTAAGLMLHSARRTQALDEAAPVEPPFLPSLIAGGALGFVSGITGVGGGIYLAPLILALGWASTRQTSGISAVFNLLNSAAALAGAWTKPLTFSPAMPVWLLAAGVGALIGSWAGVYRLPPTVLRMILAGILLAAGARMILT